MLREGYEREVTSENRFQQTGSAIDWIEEAKPHLKVTIDLTDADLSEEVKGVRTRYLVFEPNRSHECPYTHYISIRVNGREVTKRQNDYPEAKVISEGGKTTGYHDDEPLDWLIDGTRKKFHSEYGKTVILDLGKCVEETFERYFGYLARCAENFGIL